MFGPLLTLAAAFVVLAIGGWLTGRWLIRPLLRLSSAARRFGEGDFSTRTGVDRGDELGEVATAFDAMAARVQATLVSERALLANISHELRTPLARIRVALEIADEGDVPTAQGALRDIGTDLTEVESLIDDIVTSARLQISMSASSRIFEGSREVVAANRLAEHALRRFRTRHPSRDVELVTAPVSAELRVDVMLVRRALENLLENAHKYTREVDAPIRLEVVVETAETHFEISDRGIGIAPENLERVFQPFFRVGGRRPGDDTGGTPDGLGLGLALVRRIVEAHEGRISVRSAPNSGTTVRVSLPSVAAASSA